MSESDNRKWPPKPESPTANLGFPPRRARKKMGPSDSNRDRQPEVAIWPPKPEIILSLELRPIASKSKRQIRDYRPWQARQKCCQVIATTMDSSDSNIGAQNVCIAISGCRSLSQSPRTVFRARRGRKPQICRWNFDHICHNSEDKSISGFRCWNHLPTVSSSTLCS